MRERREPWKWPLCFGVAASLMLADLEETMPSVVRGTRDLTVDKGLDEYGDDAFHQGIVRLKDEAWQEHIDALFRWSLIAWNRDGRPWPLP